jgi:hypothetical protein
MRIVGWMKYPSCSFQARVPLPARQAVTMPPLESSVRDDHGTTNTTFKSSNSSHMHRQTAVSFEEQKYYDANWSMMMNTTMTNRFVQLVSLNKEQNSITTPNLPPTTGATATHGALPKGAMAVPEGAMAAVPLLPKKRRNLLLPFAFPLRATPHTMMVPKMTMTTRTL